MEWLCCSAHTPYHFNKVKPARATCSVMQEDNLFKMSFSFLSLTHSMAHPPPAQLLDSLGQCNFNAARLIAVSSA